MKLMSRSRLIQHLKSEVLPHLSARSNSSKCLLYKYKLLVFACAHKSALIHTFDSFEAGIADAIASFKGMKSRSTLVFVHLYNFFNIVVVKSGLDARNSVSHTERVNMSHIGYYIYIVLLKWKECGSLLVE